MAKTKMTVEDYDGYGVATFEGKEYVLLEEIGPSGNPRNPCGVARALPRDAEPDEDGYYPCVCLEFEQSVEEWEASGESGEVASNCIEDGDLFDLETEEFVE